MKISRRRQHELAQDQPIIEHIYQSACDRWGVANVESSPTLTWTLRTMLGMSDQLPFGTGLHATNLGEFMFVLRDLCGHGRPSDTKGDHQS